MFVASCLQRVFVVSSGFKSPSPLCVPVMSLCLVCLFRPYIILPVSFHVCHVYPCIFPQLILSLPLSLVSPRPLRQTRVVTVHVSLRLLITFLQLHFTNINTQCIDSHCTCKKNPQIHKSAVILQCVLERERESPQEPEASRDGCRRTGLSSTSTSNKDLRPQISVTSVRPSQQEKEDAPDWDPTAEGWESWRTRGQGQLTPLVAENPFVQACPRHPRTPAPWPCPTGPRPSHAHTQAIHSHTRLATSDAQTHTNQHTLGRS